MNPSTLTRKPNVREKLLTHGPQSLSDQELLAVFISSGSGQRSCLELAQDLLTLFGDLRQLLNADYKTFMSIPGLGVVRYVQLQALREICQRGDYIGLKSSEQLTNSIETYQFLKRRLRDKKHETFVGLFLDNLHRVLAYEELSSGTIDSATIHTRPILSLIHI